MKFPNLFWTGAAALALLAFASTVDAVSAHSPQITPPSTVEFTGDYEPGTVVVNTGERQLYLVTGKSEALVYQIGVGRAGMAWKGEAEVGRKAKWPTWTPTSNMIRRDPSLARWAGGMRGGLGNPLGARAIYLYRDGRDTMYRIHGTNEPWTIGSAASSGCIRLLNQHVEDLFERVPVGARVVVL